MVVTSEASAQIANGPPPAISQLNVLPRVMPLREILRLPNKPSSKLEGSIIVTEGYLIRAIAIKPMKSLHSSGVEPHYRVHLLRKKPSYLKRLSSSSHAIIATIPARFLEAKIDVNGALISVVGARVRIIGTLKLDLSRKEHLNRSQGSLWEIRAVSDVQLCPDESCPLLPDPEPPISSEAATRWMP